MAILVDARRPSTRNEAGPILITKINRTTCPHLICFSSSLFSPFSPFSPSQVATKKPLWLWERSTWASSGCTLVAALLSPPPPPSLFFLLLWLTPPPRRRQGVHFDGQQKFVQGRESEANPCLLPGQWAFEMPSIF